MRHSGVYRLISESLLPLINYSANDNQPAVQK